MLQARAKLICNKRGKENYFHLVLKAPSIARQSGPGQFVNIKVNDNCQPLLRRPFSIYRVGGSEIEILYEVVGKGTDILSQRKAGEYLDLIGPLGEGFDYRAASEERRAAILIAGGMGVAPLIFLAEKIAEVKSQKSKSKILVLLGAKTKNQVLCEKEFKELGCDVKISTDDGSRGFKGKATDSLKFLLSTMNYEQSTIYACGPRPMLKEISRISKEKNIPAQVSLEEHMACGIGACLGCAVKTRVGFKRVCKDGPVFNAREIIWG